MPLCNYKTKFTTFFPTYYRILYSKIGVLIFSVIYTNTVHIKNLQKQEELDENRSLLTLTAMFTYHRELRWVWMVLAMSTTIIYAGIVPNMFKIYFVKDEKFRQSMNRQISDIQQKTSKHTGWLWRNVTKMAESSHEWYFKMPKFCQFKGMHDMQGI